MRGPQDPWVGKIEYELRKCSSSKAFGEIFKTVVNHFDNTPRLSWQQAFVSSSLLKAYKHFQKSSNFIAELVDMANKSCATHNELLPYKSIRAAFLLKLLVDLGLDFSPTLVDYIHPFLSLQSPNAVYMTGMTLHHFSKLGVRPCKISAMVLDVVEHRDLVLRDLLESGRVSNSSRLFCALVSEEKRLHEIDETICRIAETLGRILASLGPKLEPDTKHHLLRFVESAKKFHHATPRIAATQDWAFIHLDSMNLSFEEQDFCVSNSMFDAQIVALPFFKAWFDRKILQGSAIQRYSLLSKLSRAGLSQIQDRRIEELKFIIESDAALSAEMVHDAMTLSSSFLPKKSAAYKRVIETGISDFERFSQDIRLQLFYDYAKLYDKKPLEMTTFKRLVELFESLEVGGSTSTEDLTRMAWSARRLGISPIREYKMRIIFDLFDGRGDFTPSLCCHLLIAFRDFESESFREFEKFLKVVIWD